MVDQSLSSQHERLRELLADLRRRVEGTDSLDDSARGRLQSAIDDLESRAAPPSEHVPHLTEMAVSFEAEHPALAGTLRRLADLLGKAGI